jgi:putative endonuclease
MGDSNIKFQKFFRIQVYHLWMEQNKRSIGTKFEQKALQYLVESGMRLLEQNWYFNHKGELDLICWDEGSKMIVFVEVRERAQMTAYSQVISKKKLNRLFYLARLWLQKNHHNEYKQPWRIDLLVYVGSKEEPMHIKGLRYR